MEELGTQSESPLRDVFVKHWRPVLVCIGLVLFYNVAVYAVLFYMPTTCRRRPGSRRPRRCSTSSA